MIAVAIFFITVPFILAFLAGMLLEAQKKTDVIERRVYAVTFGSVAAGCLLLYGLFIHLLWAHLP